MNQKNNLQIKQLDKKLSKMNELKEIAVPQKGWLYAVRNTLNMSLKQFGNRLNITPQSAKEIEEREINRNITLKNLADAANALDMQLVYGLVPKGSSIESIIEKNAKRVAREIVMRTSHTMSLEDQENLPDRISIAIEEKANHIKNELPRYLWD
ncbi:MAG: XRE family transcriptional regulator [Ignavibacteriales bacterium CG18_big_fil_WC_8_21_14_2_50_31_20]|nr:MAG: XRE family transcriptional regulator [Ignavibacteriales bacterium CG18_big_fil_WC_8_21_14_2_50_31_20]